MKIGVDARLLSKTLTGIGRYTLEMCRALLKQNDIELYLYSPSPIPPSITNILEPATIRSTNIENVIFRQLWSELYLPLWAKQDDVDIFWGPAHRLPTFLPKKITSVVTIHDLVWKYFGETMRPFSRILESYQSPRAINKADHVIADSKATAKSVSEEFNIPNDRLSVVYLGANHLLDHDNILPLQKFDISQAYFLFVGTLEPRKNLSNLLLAYSKLPTSIKEKNLCFIAGGQGWGNVNLRKIISDLDLSSYVKIIGYVNETELATLYSHAKFLAMPSLYEGFGLPLIEAMSKGTPVLTSNNSSMIEVAGNAGILVNPMDITSIKEALYTLMENDNYRNSLCQKARHQASLFDWNHSAHQLVDVFQKAIKHRKSR